MALMDSKQIREQFIEFFVRKHGHVFVPSSPVVPQDDPTLLFTNAGMNQFKPYFLGADKAPWKRVANTQKCIRAGGKHNDLDDVGRSRRHHTFFEMLGNWSFGDYFKQGAIEMAWELLTKVWKLDPSRLHVSVYAGDPATGVPRDEEAVAIWKQVAGIPDDRIHFGGKDNFWEMGDTGPCGPCTEIFIDRTLDKTGGPSVLSGEDPRVMEIWNNVFIQYNRNPDKSLTPLPSQHVDTGMGFERICQVLQGKDDNYAIDLFDPFWEALTNLSARKYTGKYPKSNVADPVAEAADEQLRTDIAFRVIADHIRCLTFALTDGAVPSNEGRGYVLRRILRRAVRFGRQQLDMGEPFMHKLAPVVVDVMGGAFPELKKNTAHVVELIKDEEVSFGKTLDRGIALFEEAAERGKGKTIEGRDAFMLHDTYGFPIDLTRVMAEERGMKVDTDGYEKLMEEAKDRARAGGREGASRLFELPPDILAKLSQSGVKATDDSFKFNAQPIGATIRAIWDGNQLFEATNGSKSAGQGVAIILDKTNFYAEMGGQVGDTGELRTHAGAVMAVETTRVAGGFVLHVGNMIEGKISVGDHVTATLGGVRPCTEKNHTSTHLANWALREILGDSVQQKGSLVDPDKLRFDFSHGKAMSEDEIAGMETLVNERIGKKLPVYAEVAPQEQALKINSLRAVFGEKYPPMVRVVSIGVPVGDLLKEPANPKWREYSIEFCGGTHLGNTERAEAFVVTGEESVSKGIRRIIALTGPAARNAQKNTRQLDENISKSKAVADAEIATAISELTKMLSMANLPLLAKRRGQAAVAELQARQKAFEKSQKSTGGSGIDVASIASKLVDEAEAVGNGKVIVAEIAGANDEQLRTTMDSLKKRCPSHGIFLASAGDGKVSFVAAVSDDFIAKGLKAGDWVREAAKVAGGGGGGRPQMAQAGGKDPTKLPDALEVARQWTKKFIANG
jgi:alanyl-tRNA synthetase